MQILIDLNNENLELDIRGENWEIREAEQQACHLYEIVKPYGVSCLYKFSDWVRWALYFSHHILLSPPSGIPSCLHLPSVWIKGEWLASTGIKGISHHCLALFQSLAALNSQRSICDCLISAGIRDVCRHCLASLALTGDSLHTLILGQGLFVITQTKHHM